MDVLTQQFNKLPRPFMKTICIIKLADMIIFYLNLFRFSKVKDNRPFFPQMSTCILKLVSSFKVMVN